MRHIFKVTEFSDEDIMHAYGILQVNSYGDPWLQPGYLAIFERSSLLEHCCHANCFVSVTKTGQILIRAAVPIARGESLSVCYQNSLHSTTERRQELLKTKYFWCRCIRCVDPTEMGTYFSAVSCLQPGCDGMCVPSAEWLNSEPEEDQMEPAWSCCSCNQSLPYAQVQLQLLMANVNWKVLDFFSLSDCKEFLQQYEAIQQLSPNHAYLTQVRLKLALELGISPGGLKSLSQDELNMKEQLCRQLLKLICTLCPTDILMRVSLTYSLWLTKFEDIASSKAAGKIDDRNLNQIIKELYAQAVELTAILHGEPKVLYEDKMVEHAKRLTEIVNFLSPLHALTIS